ncbi:MAG: hypothetical protein LC781_09355 [Actinobacteria bacterium]|nr:hypothetical protein [Actinomycetota bacterium]
MKRALSLVIVGALLLGLFAGAAAAASFVCSTVPCIGTKKDDTIGERDGSVHDEIYARAGNDRVNAARAGDDADTVVSGPGRDVVFANDGDTRDKIYCGSDRDTAYIDVFRDQNSVVSLDTTVGCERVIRTVTFV